MNGPGDPIKIKGRRNKKRWKKDYTGGDPVKAAKKEIRKGGNVLGGGNVVDAFGSKHGYGSLTSDRLEGSRLVQRKKAKYWREAYKDEVKDLKSKKAKKHWNDPEAIASGFGGNKARRETIKEIKKDGKENVKGSKRFSKQLRKKTKATIKENKTKAKKENKIQLVMGQNSPTDPWTGGTMTPKNVGQSIKKQAQTKWMKMISKGKLKP
jgi:hypothetical protein